MPLYSEKENKGKEAGSRYIGSTVSTLFLLGIIFSGFISLLLFVSQKLLFNNVNQDLFLAAKPLFLVMIWISPFAIAATLLGSFWYFHKKYSKFPVAQLLGAIFSLISTYVLFHSIGVWSLVIGFLVNIVVQLFIILPNVNLKIFKPNLTIVLPLLISWAPLIVSNFAVRSDTLLMRSFGSQMGPGQLVYLNLVTKMYSLGSGIVTIGLQILFLPNLLERFNQKKYSDADKLVKKTKAVGILLSVVSSLAIMFIGPLLIKYLFVGGKYTYQDYSNTIPLFYIFLIPSFAWGLNSIFFQPLIALKKTWLLGIINTISLIVAWATTSALFVHPSFVYISIGLSILLFGGIIGSEIVWQIERKKILA